MDVGTRRGDRRRATIRARDGTSVSTHGSHHTSRQRIRLTASSQEYQGARSGPQLAPPDLEGSRVGPTPAVSRILGVARWPSPGERDCGSGFLIVDSHTQLRAAVEGRSRDRHARVVQLAASALHVGPPPRCRDLRPPEEVARQRQCHTFCPECSGFRLLPVRLRAPIAWRLTETRGVAGLVSPLPSPIR
jgi:hypothetical protein